MDKTRKQRLEERGWTVGSTEEFLGLSPDEAAYIELKLRLAEAFAKLRRKSNLSQVQAAELLGTSQSRISKMEAGEASVSIDLLIRSSLALGAVPKEIARAIEG